MVTTRPRPLSRRAGRARRVNRTVDISVSSQAARQSSSSNWSKLPAGGPPVLLTRISAPPNRSRVAATSRARASGSVDSPISASPRALPGSASTSATACSSRLPLRANIATLQPSAASAMAAARPMPEDAPLTIAVHPSRPRSMVCEHSFTMFRLGLLNPNTDLGHTEAMAGVARGVLPEGSEVLAASPQRGPGSIESAADAVVAAAEMLALLGSLPPQDAYLVACFGDPGVDAARELTDAPVVGIGEAAFRAACLVGTRFGVVTTLPRG